MTAHLISRVTILGTGLIGGSFAKALRKYTTDMHISGWDRPDVARIAQSSRVFDEASTGDLAPVLRTADLIFIALPIGVTIDLLPEIGDVIVHHPVRGECVVRPRAIEELFTAQHTAARANKNLH